MKFCDYIRERREQLGLAQKEIAGALSVDIPMYSRYERGQRPIKEEHIPIIASKLNVDSSELRKMWIADKVISMVNDEKNAADILNLAAKNFDERKPSEDGN